MNRLLRIQKFVRRRRTPWYTTGKMCQAGGNETENEKNHPPGLQGKGDVLPHNTSDMNDTSHLDKPQEPGENDCCGNGCQECVWTVYWDAIAQYQGHTSARQPTAFELLEQRLQREQALRDKQAAAATNDMRDNNDDDTRDLET